MPPEINLVNNTFDADQFKLIVLLAAAFGLLIVNFFRVNIAFVFAGIMVNIGLTQVAGIPPFLFWAAILLSVGEAAAFVARAGGTKRKRASRRYVG